MAGYYVLAPDRQGAHNWQGVGCWSAFAALRALGALALSTSSAASGTLPLADTSRVLFAGHSMGGAGAWFAALAAPDLAIAAAPAAGWLVKEAYSDANRAFGFDSSEPLAQPRLAATLLAAVRDQRADAFAAALIGVPTHVRVGADDATVHPYFSRRMVRLLRAAGAGGAPKPGPGLVLEEVAEKGHWWWDTERDNDGGALNDATMRAFYEAHRTRLSAAAAQGRGEGAGGEGAGSEAPTTLPSDFVVLCANPRTHWSGRGGVSVLQLTHAQSEARVEVRVREEGWLLDTAGARRLRVVLPRGGAARLRPRALVVDGGEPIAVAPRDDTLHLCAHGDGTAWHVCFRGGDSGGSGNDAAAAAAVAADGSAAETEAEAVLAAGEWAFELSERGPHNAGTMRAVTATPFAIVYGTSSKSPAATEALLRGAQLLSQGHALASHAFAPVVADVDVRFCDVGEEEGGCLPCGTNLVLLGGPAQNAVTARLHAEQRGRGFAVRFPGPASAETGFEPFAIGARGFAANGTALLAAVGWADARASCAGAGAGGSIAGAGTGAGAGAGALFGAIDALASPARLALLVAGTDADGLFAALRFAAPVIPPMVRAPYSNLFPDVMVLGPRVLREGYGGVLLAGYFDARWNLDEVASWAVR